MLEETFFPPFLEGSLEEKVRRRKREGMFCKFIESDYETGH